MELTATNRSRAWPRERCLREAASSVWIFEGIDEYSLGESYSGSIAVSKTVHGGSNPSSPVLAVPKALMMMWVFGTFVL